MVEISSETSKNLSFDLTNDHPATVFGMVKSVAKIPMGGKITSCRVKAVKNEGCDLSYAICRGELCELQQSFYRFESPLESGDDLAKRIPTIHRDVCSAKVHWLVTNPFALMIFVTCLSLGYGTLFLGIDGMVDAFAEAPRLESGISTIFGSTKTFATCAVGAWWFSVIAHGIESVMVTRQCLQVLHLDAGTTITWTILVFFVGFPIFSQLEGIVKAQEESSKAK